MSALDEIKDRRNKRTKLPTAKWRSLPQKLSQGERSFIEVDGVRKGPLDWEKSRFLDGQLWAFYDGQYWVLETANDIDNPPGPPPKFGPMIFPSPPTRTVYMIDLTEERDIPDAEDAVDNLDDAFEDALISAYSKVAGTLSGSQGGSSGSMEPTPRGGRDEDASNL